jgi:hypothetical protein
LAKAPVTAGYSGKPLIQKLGIKEGMKCTALNAPARYPALLGKLPTGVKIQSKLAKEMDFIHLFSVQAGEVAKKFPLLVKSLAEKGMIWISWPKKTSSIATDLNEHVVREIGLKLGVVDVKVCAVDEDWSGLKFLRRKK